MPIAGGPRDQTLDVAGVPIAMRVAGSGPPLLFLHGPDGVPSWLPFFDGLAAAHTVYVPEHPGFGRSPQADWIRDVPDLAMLYLEMLDAMNLRGLSIIGHSLGGWIAAEMAVRSCERIASLGLIAPAGVRLKGVLSGDDFIWSPEERTRNLFSDADLADQILARATTDAEIEASIGNRFAAARYGWQPRWFDPRLEKWLHRVRVPVDVIWGEDDRFLPAAYAAVWSRQLFDARVHLLPGCGHLPHVERCARVLELLAPAR